MSRIRQTSSCKRNLKNTHFGGEKTYVFIYRVWWCLKVSYGYLIDWSLCIIHKYVSVGYDVNFNVQTNLNCKYATELKKRLNFIALSSHFNFKIFFPLKFSRNLNRKSIKWILAYWPDFVLHFHWLYIYSFSIHTTPIPKMNKN